MKRKLFTAIIGILILITAAACAPSMASIALASAPKAQPERIVAAPEQQTTTVPGSVRTLTVSGVGTILLDPDIAHVTVGVHTEDENVSTGIDANNAAVKKVRDALVKFGIQATDIQTQNFSVYTIQNYDPSGKSTGMRYAIDNSLYVTVRDLSQLGKLLGEVTSNGANNINGISFDVSDKSKALVDARKQALENAQKQAEEMAGNLNVTLGDVQSAVVNTVESPWPMPYGLGGGGAAQAATNVPISAGQITVQVNIQMVYEID